MDTNSENTQTPDFHHVAMRRPHETGMLTGTAAGLAEYLSIDPTIVRVGFVALTLLGGLGVPLYLASWLLIPEEGTDVSIANDLIDRSRYHGPHAPHGVPHGA
ncbi:MAG: PspC domain-containing protein [Acidimicrobiales bacterium]|jgi:phage shock protein PspC (stress-responsive transcriptional regulator)